ncbi:MAG: hypothetical protein VYD90_13230 [Pseudomonadota bacterium]|nr:hypothetical protein [Pseudomonadota bacterium]
MPSLFPETIAADLGKRKVTVAFLVLFDFTSAPVRLWRGSYTLRTKDGERWKGLGKLGSVSGIQQAVNGNAPEISFTLSGVDDEILRKVRQEFTAEVKGRHAYVLIQFFGVDDPDDPDNQRPLDNPYPIAAARMLRPEYAADRDSGERSVTIKAESLFSLRSRPRYSMYTDSDQRARYPMANDKGFEFVGEVVNKVVTWPDY